MLFMESYLCYCSVRLGVIVVAVINIIANLVISGFFFAKGIEFLEPLIDLLEHDEEYKHNSLVRKGLQWIQDAPDKVLLIFQLHCYANITAGVLGIFGAIKLLKWLLIPLSLFEFLSFLEMTSLHIVLMIMLKKIINLGLLIVLTLMGSFIVLFVGYNCVTCIAMFQIISLVRSSRYREIYGDDPFHPLALNNARSESVQQLHVLDMPDDKDIDEQKRLAKLQLWPRRRPPLAHIIAVIPVQNPGQLKWWQQQAVDTDDKMLEAEVLRNWQHDELLRGVGGNVERKTALNRKYGEQWQHY